MELKPSSTAKSVSPRGRRKGSTTSKAAAQAKTADASLQSNNTAPDASSWSSAEVGDRRWQIECIRQSGLFDVKYYLETHRDARESGVDPVEHFHDVGYHKGYK